MSLKSKIKKLIPERLISYYHLILAVLAGFYYSWPSKKMVVIGITGTKGKTSSANFIWSVLMAGGHKTGLIGTANIRIGNIEILNKYHMTMPGRFILQKLLKQMADFGCKFAIVETTSEGIKQWRHYGIYYDIAVFTNLHPEHLQAHGSFEKYKETKGELFKSLYRGSHKIIEGKKIKKIIIVNSDDLHKEYFLNFPADKKITFGIDNGPAFAKASAGKADFTAKDIRDTSEGLEFSVNDTGFKINILGKFNVYNALPAIAISSVFGASDKQIQGGFKNLKIIPGRMEKINEGQKFLVFVDYAHEKEGMSAVLDTAKDLVADNGGKIIVLLGAEGGGRDKAKRPVLGEIAAKKADFVVISNVDPYEDDPKEILEDIAVAAGKFGKIRGQNLFVIEDRREGIKRALSLASQNDIVLITGKGSEQSIVIGGKRYPWDDRVVVREILREAIINNIRDALGRRDKK